MPTVSAIIPTYNRAHFILEALESVLLQSRPVDEIIVVDDGSTDNTAEVLKPYRNRIRYIRQQNRGAGAARNRGMKEAKGDYIAFLDSDDIWVKDKTKIQIDFFNKHPSVDFVFGDMANFTKDEDNDMPEIKSLEIHDYLVAHSSNLDRIFDCLIVENFIPTPTVLFKRSCISRVGFFDEKLRIAEDLDFWLRAARSCRFGFINATLARRRRHPDNLINDWISMNLAHLEVLRRVKVGIPNLSPKTQQLLRNKIFRIHYDLGSSYFKKGDFSTAWSHFISMTPPKLIHFKWLVKLICSFFLQYFVSRRSCVVSTNEIKIYHNVYPKDKL